MFLITSQPFLRLLEGPVAFPLSFRTYDSISFNIALFCLVDAMILSDTLD